MSPTDLGLELDSDLDMVSYHLRQPLSTAVGGTQTFRVYYRGTIPAEPGPELDVPYTAESTDEHLRIEDVTGTSITIRGLAAGKGALRFLRRDGSLIDEVPLSVAEIRSIRLEPRVSELLPGGVYSVNNPLFAWAPGEYTFKVGLYQDIFRLADTSMRVALEGAERTGLDELHLRNASVGTYPISVTAGSWRDAALDFVVVDHADSMSLMTEPAPTSLTSGRGTNFCFQARSADRYILGLTWTISVVGDVEPQASNLHNCTYVIPRQTSGSVTVRAAAGGQSLSITLPVVAM
jgi:hypothetical protein